jgi:PAS domain-containing protein
MMKARMIATVIAVPPVGPDSARARSNEADDDRDSDGSSSGGSRSKPAKEVSLTDPQAAWVTRPGVDPFFAHDANYLIDNKAGIIVDAEGSRANRAVEIAVTQTMVERVRRRTLHFENRIMSKDGSYRWLSWFAVQDRGLIYATGRDVTDIKRAEEQLHILRRELAGASRQATVGVMTASIAHEIKQRCEIDGAIHLLRLIRSAMWVQVRV